jgi:hypothetical protein
VGRNAKLRNAAAVVAIVALITVVLKLSIIITIAILVIGIGAIVFLLRQGDDDDEYEGGSTKTKAKPAKAKKGKARLDEILDDKAAKAGGTTATARTAAPKPAPGGGLPTWTPGSVDSTSTDEESAEPFDTTSSEGSWDTWEKEWPADADTLILEEDDPLASLDRLDDIDPVAEVERLDAADDDPFASLRGDFEVDTEVEETFELDELTELDDDPIAAPSASGSAFSFSAAPAVINEEVSTADDIMAASTATELHVEDAGDSELARLLAKVQARLSAYE